MDTLVVQMGIKHGRVAELTRSDNGRLTVGRSYENDLVLTDRYVAPAQVEFCQQGLKWQMRVLEHTNPVLLNNIIVEGDVVDVASGDKVTVGRTHLSLYSTSDPVEATSKLLLSNWLTRDSTSSVLPLLVLLGVCVFDFLLTYLEGSTDLKWQDDARSGLFTAIGIVIWAGLWALAGRIIRQQHHMGLQLIATTGAYLLAILLSLIAILIAGAVHSALIGDYLFYVLYLIVLTALFRLNLLIATNVQRTLTVACVLAVLVVAVPYVLATLAETDDFQDEPEYSNSLLPPLAQFGSSSSSDEYFSAVSAEAKLLEED